MRNCSLTADRLLAMATAAALLLVLSPMAAASSHREAPRITGDPKADNTDVYAFVSPEHPDRVVLISNYVPLQEPAGGPNFFAWDDHVHYQILIDNDADGKPDLIYTFDFTLVIRNGRTFLYNTGPITSLDDPDYNMVQLYSVTRRDVDAGHDELLAQGLISPPANIGPASTPNYESLAAQGIYTVADGSRAFAGQRDEGFYVDLGGIFDLLTIRVPPGDHGGGVDGTAGFNISTIALEVPMARLTRTGLPPTDKTDGIIGVWSTAVRYDPAHPDQQTQVSRLGMPLVNEVLIPLNLKDQWNGSQPKDEIVFLQAYLNPEPARLITLLYGISVPPYPRADIATVFLTGVPGLNKPPGVVPSEMLRLNMLIPPAAHPNRFGVLAGDVAGFPNGRRVGDDVVDIELRVLAGVLVTGFNVAPNNQLGDGVDQNDVPYLTVFPFLGTPHQGFLHDHH